MVIFFIVLVALRLKNIALIDSLELGFDSGFTVLTGETGAGKSILLDALDALLGGYQTTLGSRLLRAGTSTSFVEAVFSLDAPVKKWLIEQEIEIDDQELLVSRHWHMKDDRLINRCRVNGFLINKKQVSSLRPLLIDLTLQGHTDNFSSSSNQLAVVDSFGSLQLTQTLEDVQKSWSTWKQLFVKHETAKKDLEQFQQDNLILEMELNDLEELNLDSSDEDKVLEIEQDKLVNSVKLKESLGVIFNNLNTRNDGYPSISDQLAICVNEIRTMSKVDPSVSNILDQVFELQDLATRLSIDLENYNFSLTSNHEDLENIQNRLTKLQRIQRRYGKNLSDLIQRRNFLRESFESKSNQDSLFSLEKQLNQARIQRDLNNESLNKKRIAIADLLEQSLIEYLKPLGLSNVRFSIQFQADSPSSLGSDRVQFLFSANPGQPLAPLVDVASGGEMSRFLLALKTLLSNSQESAILLFDEIDSGVSGRVSEAIAKVLKQLSLKRQVFCVTHQPLVAAAADHHYLVNKTVVNGITCSNVSSLLTFDERQKALAELAGGDRNDASAYAASLLGHHAA